VNIGLIYCQGCARGGRAQWVLNEALRRIEALLALDEPSTFFVPMLNSSYLAELPDMRRLLGAKNMLLDQAHVDDALETSAWRRHSRRRTIAAWLPFEQGRQIMRFYGWNTTKFENPGPGPPWTHDDRGLVWEALNYPEAAKPETVRRSSVGTSKTLEGVRRACDSRWCTPSCICM
jgi:hypothetical protein